MSTPANRPASRYGTSESASPIGQPKGIASKVVAIGGVILMAAIIIAVGRYIINREDQAVSITMASHERVDDSTMRLWVDVTRDDTTVPSYCIVTAIDYSMAEVGRRELLIPTGGNAVQRIQVDIPSRDLPVSGGVYGCSTTIPSHMQFSE